MFACLFCDGDLVRLLILRRGYVLAALIATTAGYIGFFHLLPGADIGSSPTIASARPSKIRTSTVHF